MQKRVKEDAIEMSTINQAQLILDVGFAIEGVPDEYKAEAEKVVERIMEAYANETLETLHAAPCRRTAPDKLEFERAVAMYEGTYSGSYEIDAAAYPEIAIGDEASVLIVGIKGHANNPVKSLHIFPVRPLTPA